MCERVGCIPATFGTARPDDPGSGSRDEFPRTQPSTANPLWTALPRGVPNPVPCRGQPLGWSLAVRAGSRTRHGVRSRREAPPCDLRFNGGLDSAGGERATAIGGASNSSQMRLLPRRRPHAEMLDSTERGRRLRFRHGQAPFADHVAKQQAGRPKDGNAIDTWPPGRFMEVKACPANQNP